MRTKASQLHLHIAAAFANAVTVRNSDEQWPLDSLYVNYRGPSSIFSALKVSIPQIIRLSASDDHKGKKGAVSEIELNKFLARSGYISIRHRNRIKGTKNKWTKGFRRWKHLRWADTRNSEELRELRAKLEEIQIQFSGFCFINESELGTFLSNLKYKPNEGSSPPEFCEHGTEFVGFEPGEELDAAMVDPSVQRWKMPPETCAADEPSQKRRPGVALQRGRRRHGHDAPTTGAPRFWRAEPVPFPHFITHHRCACPHARAGGKHSELTRRDSRSPSINSL